MGRHVNRAASSARSDGLIPIESADAYSSPKLAALPALIVDRYRQP